MSLQKFLNSNPVDNITKEVPISPRLKDEATGEYFKAKIRAVTDTEMEAYRKGAMNIKKNGEVELDSGLFQRRVVINNTIEPNFKDAESIKATGVTSPEAYLSKVLLAGEIQHLFNEIQVLSGFNVDMTDLVKEAKN